MIDLLVFMAFIMTTKEFDEIYLKGQWLLMIKNRVHWKDLIVSKVAFIEHFRFSIAHKIQFYHDSIITMSA